ncbi:hypothetical protein [Pendulispora albinea]|uniref:VWA domain-containing protein n=1 Tax=Pendulispora albinea TaxID=2741071 RepID=A0ABZ2LKF3_9BACT
MRMVPVGTLLIMGLSIASGCLTRKVGSLTPDTTESFTRMVRTTAVDKVDLLFMIDNSRSMGDKQNYLKSAIPDLLNRLVTPNCVDENDPNEILGVSRDNGVCPAGAKVEFPPVRNMHIGVVTSSLGSRLGLLDECNPDQALSNGLNAHNDDRGHLINRATAAETPVATMQPSNFLAWFPKVPDNATKSPGPGAVPFDDAAKLQQQFQDVVAGVSQFGCGIESQLESWYRFLVQPDPYESLAIDKEPDGTERAKWVGVDSTIIKQRHDFLRPDSLVAVIVLSDENDSEIDVRAFHGTAFHFMQPVGSPRGSYTPGRGTAPCEAHPEDPACTACDFLSAERRAADPSCRKGPYTSNDDWGANMNLRHVHTKAKYGADPQFPISRYVTGLTSPRIPDRTGEYPKLGNYVGQPNCQNPLFAASLPDGSDLSPQALCNLPPGSRTTDLIFYAHIGGVPHALLHFDPNDAEKSRLTDADWTKILGRDPLGYDYTGIDPHMIESYEPRPGVGHPETEAGNGADPVHGREWITNARGSVDRQFACTFETPEIDCTKPENGDICDCPKSAEDAAKIPASQRPPLCKPGDPTKQIRAKAYPTIRELLVARLMGRRGVVASICPEHVREESPNDPRYGYRPAVASIVDRLKDAFLTQCVPRKLSVQNEQVLCHLLETLPEPGDQGACDNPAKGLRQPDPGVLSQFLDEKVKEWERGGGAKSGLPHPRTLPVCEIVQLPALQDCSKSDSDHAGWCYVEGGKSSESSRCAQAILFSKKAKAPSGAVVDMQCLVLADEDAGAKDAGVKDAGAK